MSWTPGGYFYSGKQGEPGPVGPQGPEGPMGPQGPQGPAGSITDFSNIILSGTNMTNKFLVANNAGTGIFQVDTVNNAINVSSKNTTILPSVIGEGTFAIKTNQYGSISNLFSVNTASGNTSLSSVAIKPVLGEGAVLTIQDRNGQAMMVIQTTPSVISMSANQTTNQGNFIVNGPTNMNGNALVSGNLNVSSITNLNNGLNVIGSTSFAPSAVNDTVNFNITSVFNGPATFNSMGTFNNQVSIYGSNAIANVPLVIHQGLSTNLMQLFNATNQVCINMASSTIDNTGLITVNHLYPNFIGSAYQSSIGSNTTPYQNGYFTNVNVSSIAMNTIPSSSNNSQIYLLIQNNLNNTPIVRLSNTDSSGYGLGGGSLEIDAILPMGNLVSTLGIFSKGFTNAYITNIYGTIAGASDEKLKTNIEPTDLGLDWINQLNPIKFNWTGSVGYTGTSYGFSYQQIKSLSPTGSNFYRDPEHDDDHGKLVHSEMFAPMVKAIQELSAENDQLKARITELEAVDYSDILKSLNDRLTTLEMKGTRRK